MSLRGRAGSSFVHVDARGTSIHTGSTTFVGFCARGRQTTALLYGTYISLCHGICELTRWLFTGG